MRILLISAANSIHTVRWANAFVERGWEIHLVSQHPPITGLSSNVVMHRMPHWGGLGYLLNGPRLARLVRHLLPDVVNAHYATGYGTLARWCTGFPLVLNVWGSDVFAFPEKSFLHRKWLLRNLRSADHLVSTSGFMAQRTASLSAKLPPLTVVPFGVDTLMFSPASERSNTGPCVIGTVKSLAPIYGIDVLIRAFAILVEQGQENVRLRIVGDGPDKADLVQLAHTLGVAEQVDFVGALAHARVPEELRSMDIFVALSVSESFGVAIIEASACGLPVVVSNAGGLTEVVQHDTTGFVVPQADPEAAAARLKELIASRELRQRMGKAGRAFVEANFTWGSCVDRQLEVFQQVIDDRRRA